MLRNLWLIPVTVLAWIAPLTFLWHGQWPFFALPALGLTLWSLIAVKRECTHCGKREL